MSVLTNQKFELIYLLNSFILVDLMKKTYSFITIAVFIISFTSMSFGEAAYQTAFRNRMFPDSPSAPAVLPIAEGIPAKTPNSLLVAVFPVMNADENAPNQATKSPKLDMYLLNRINESPEIRVIDPRELADVTGYRPPRVTVTDTFIETVRQELQADVIVVMYMGIHEPEYDEDQSQSLTLTADVISTALKKQWHHEDAGELMEELFKTQRIFTDTAKAVQTIITTNIQPEIVQNDLRTAASKEREATPEDFQNLFKSIFGQ